MDNIKNIKAIFFDLDNTLIPTRKADKLACNKLNEILQNEYGFSIDEATQTCNLYLKKFRQCPDNSSTQFNITLDDWRLYLFTTVLNHKYQHKANEIYKKWLELRYKYLIITPEIKSMLLKLKKLNYQLVLISNGPSSAQWEKIHKLNLTTIFNLILVSGDLEYEKPQKQIFLLALNQLNLKATECLMCGDKLETDILGAKYANLALSIWLPLNNNINITTTNNNIKADIIINKITDLTSILLLNNNNNKYINKIQLVDDHDTNSNSSDGS